MKITVVTPFDSANYGAFLQAYCLKTQLETWGHKVSHVLTRDKDYVRGLYYRERPVSKKDKLLFWRFSAKKEYGIEKYRIFSKEQAYFQVIDDPKDSDLCILGSDEIWNINQPAFRKGVFWGENMSAAISYAASIGGASFEKFEKYPELINAARKIKVALVRDQRTREFIQKVDPSKKTDIVCDPTMLVSVDQYSRSYDDPFLKDNDCLLIYAYSLRKEEIKIIKRYAHKHGLKTVACCFYHGWCDHQCMGGPLEFSSIIQQCKGVVTTTFHGSIFSILNHANFISIPISPKTNQLLDQFGLSDRLIERDQISEITMDSVLGSQIDYALIDSRIEKIRMSSLNRLRQAIEITAETKTFDFQICPSDDCTGCFACRNKCPKQAINVITDKYGRTLPLIDPGVCVHCGLCKKVCPVANPIAMRKPKKCYAAQRSDETERKKSASGGIGAVLAEEYIRRGGVVYGAAVTKEAIVQHQRADTLEEIEAFRGSKYVQSFTANSYQDVLKDLKSGREVLFTGTPCQIAGLRSFLGKVYSNLCTVDIICHGNPPMEYLTDYIHHVARDRVINNFSFRGGERDFVLKIFSGNEIAYKKYKDEDAYFSAFLNRLSYRENCYSCKYATSNRGSDITIGDFWKLNREALVTPLKGKVSVILVSTEKGEEVLSWIYDRLVCEPRAYEEAIKGNTQLREPAKKHKDRKLFIRKYENTESFWKAVESTSITKEIVKYKRSKTIIFRGIRKIKRMMS